MNLRDPKTQKFLFLGACVFTLSYLFFFSHYLPFGFQPRRAQIKAMKMEYEKLNAELEKARQTVGNLAKLEAEYNRLHDKWIMAQDLLPGTNSVPNLMTKITKAGMQTGLQFQLFKPAAPRPHDFFMEHPVQVEVTGSYHQVGLFLSRVANLDRIINVSNLHVSMLGDGRRGGGQSRRVARARRAAGGSAARNRSQGGGDEMGTVTAEMTLKAYTLMEGGVQSDAEQANAD